MAYFKDLELHTIELKKFSSNSNEALEEMVEKIKTSLDMWTAFFTHHELLKVASLPPGLDLLHLKKAIQVLEVMSFNQQEKERYEDHLKWLRVEANTLKKYEQKGMEKGLQKGLKKGRQEGIKEGREEGIKQGMEKGKKEGLKEGMEKGIQTRNIAIAKSMLEQGHKISFIQEITGLDKDLIQSLIPK